MLLLTNTFDDGEYLHFRLCDTVTGAWKMCKVNVEGKSDEEIATLKWEAVAHFDNNLHWKGKSNAKLAQSTSDRSFIDTEIK